MAKAMARLLVISYMVMDTTCARSSDEMLMEAEDEADAQMLTVEDRREIADRVAAAIGHAGDALDGRSGSWASKVASVRFSEGGVDDEVLPYITVGSYEAELKEAPGAKGMAVLHRKQRYAGLRVDILENQLVVLSGMESAAERKERLKMGLEFENPFASKLAGLTINGTAMFMIAYRYPSVESSPDVHEIAFFDRMLWSAFVDLIGRAPQPDGSYSAMKIHWNTLPKEQRDPWVHTGAPVRVVASPSLLAPTADFL